VFSGEGGADHLRERAIVTHFEPGYDRGMSDQPNSEAVESGSSFKDRVEQVLAVMLGLAAIITAWAAFQSGQLGDKVQESYSEGIRLSDQASQQSNTAIATDNKDQALFLEYAKALVAEDEITATYISESLMSPELFAAIEWWIEQPDETGPDSPFVEENPNWNNTSRTAAAELAAEAQQYFDIAKESDSDGDRFDFLEVIVTLALFLFGVASLVRQQRIQLGLAVAGGAILIYSIAMVLLLGDPGGLF
jgi:hypothetical protein